MAFPIYTSIRPPADGDEAACLHACFGSWRDAGFEPVAVNGPGETAALRGLGLPLAFAELPADGKPRIAAILSAVRAGGAPFAGILNADCRIVADPGLAARMTAGLAGTLRVAWRLDVGGGRPDACLGFDGWFFDPAILPADDVGYAIAGPWWDYWFPLACEVAGARVETIPVPLLTHRVHPPNYDHPQELAGGTRFWTALKKWYAEGRDRPDWPFADLVAREGARESVSPALLVELGRRVRPFIRRNAPAVAGFLPPGLEGIEATLRLCGEALLAHAEAPSEVDHLRAEADRLRAEIAGMRGSRSWRVTAPLRSVHGFVSRRFLGRSLRVRAAGPPPPDAVAWPCDTVWLASWPRSGNTYLRAILWTCFGLPTGSVYRDDLRGDAAVAERTGHVEGAASGDFPPAFLRLPLVKTHGLPGDGRRAIYVVRDGRDCCRSLFGYWRAEGDRRITLADIIAGRHQFGSWSGHYLAWDPEARPGTLFLRFEDLTGDFGGTLERLSAFLGVRPLRTEPPPPVPARGGPTEGPTWLSPGATTVRAMTRAENALFERLHGAVAARLGYPAPPRPSLAAALLPRPQRR